MVHLAKRDRSIDWLDTTRRQMQTDHDDIASNLLTERLTALLLERLPTGVAAQMIELLPAKPNRRLLLAAASDANPSIGFPSFVEAAEQVLGSADLQADVTEHARATSERFLWVIAQDFPPELKMLMREWLPLELRSRMNLYLASSEDSRVA